MGNAELRRALDQVVESDRLRLAADAQELRGLSYLIAHYQAGQAEDPIALPACEQFVLLGGEGTPRLSEFLALELAAARGISTYAAGSLLSDVVNLEYRHPVTHRAVLDARLPLWLARKMAAMCADLSCDAAAWVDARWYPPRVTPARGACPQGPQGACHPGGA